MVKNQVHCLFAIVVVAPLVEIPAVLHAQSSVIESSEYFQYLESAQEGPLLAPRPATISGAAPVYASVVPSSHPCVSKQTVTTCNHKNRSFGCAHCNLVQQKLASRKRERIAEMQASHWGYAANTCVLPFGYAVHHARHTQSLLGMAENNTLYRYDFFPENTVNSAQLTVFGQDRLRTIANKTAAVGVPVRIEATLDNELLDEQRRIQVLEFAHQENLSLPSEMIVLIRNPPTTLGVESGLMYETRLRSVRSGGVTSTGSGQTASPAAQIGVTTPIP